MSPAAEPTAAQPRPRRNAEVVRAELAALDRYLAAAPPHAAGPDLASRRTQLERELAALRRAESQGGSRP